MSTSFDYARTLLGTEFQSIIQLHQIYLLIRALNKDRILVPKRHALFNILMNT